MTTIEQLNAVLIENDEIKKDNARTRNTIKLGAIPTTQVTTHENT